VNIPVAEPRSEDVVEVLRQQHQRIKALFALASSAVDGERAERFDELRAMLAVHEVGEELVLRPVSKELVGEDVTSARNAEEKHASQLLADLEDVDPHHPDFTVGLAELEAAVLEHAHSEEAMEFPAVLSQKSAEERARLGRALLAVESLAPTHPHPSVAGSTTAQLVVGPFVSLLDRARDAVGGILGSEGGNRG
jgi:hemerythrin superfamily protein